MDFEELENTMEWEDIPTISWSTIWRMEDNRNKAVRSHTKERAAEGAGKEESREGGSGGIPCRPDGGQMVE